MTAEPFTYGAYAEILDAAVSSDYEAVEFETLASEPAREPALVIRHDIDLSLGRMVPIARLEADRGVRATYCLQTCAPVYSLDDEPSIAAVRAVLEYGHALGLHFNSAGMSDDEALERVPEQAAELERRFDVTVRVVSFHMPSHRPADHLQLPNGLINAYAPEFFERIGYASDSSHDWRGKDIRALLLQRAHPQMQILTHPALWRERFTSLRTIVEESAHDGGISMEDAMAYLGFDDEILDQPPGWPSGSPTEER